MKRSKRLSCLFLAILMICCLCSTSAFAANNTVKAYKQYTVLGDSIPAGYGPYNYEHKGYAKIPVSYPGLVADKVAEDYIPLARTGFRTAELRYMLEDDYEGDPYLFRIGKTSPEDIYLHRPEYKPAIAESDLLTLGIGSNDILNYGMIRAIDASKDPMITNKVREILEESGDYMQALSTLLTLTSAVESVSGIVTGFIQGMSEGYLNFMKNWECIMEDIYTLNPDVTMVVVGMYNPLKTTKLLDSSLITIGRAFDMITAGMNTFMKQGSRYSDRYLFVDTVQTEIYDLPALTDGMYMDMLLGMVHPTKAGHRYIANEILNVLNVSDTVEEPVVLDVSPKYLDLTDHTAFVSGYSDGSFRPGNSATRAEVASMLCSLLAEEPADTSAVSFSDISGHWGERQIKAVSSLGIMQGYSDGTFRPDTTITRAEFATIAAYLFDDVETKSVPFSDTSGHWAETYIAKAYSQGLIAGYADGTFKPDRNVTRAQLVAILNRAMGRDPDIKSIAYFMEESSFGDVDPSAWYYNDVMEASNSHSYKTNKDVEMWTGVEN